MLTWNCINSNLETSNARCPIESLAIKLDCLQIQAWLRCFHQASKHLYRCSIRPCSHDNLSDLQCNFTFRDLASSLPRTSAIPNDLYQTDITAKPNLLLPASPYSDDLLYKANFARLHSVALQQTILG